MKIIIAGGNGFLGEALTRHFEENGHQVIILTRKPVAANHIKWDAIHLGEWTACLEGADVLINLVGKSVDCRYTLKNKIEIVSSRIDSTRVLQKAVEGCINPPTVWLNASSATIYIHAETQTMTEENGIIGDDFSMNVCKAWEKEFFDSSNKNIRKVALRTSIVMGNKGGAFPKLALVTKLGLGGIQGRGNQMVSWIHIQDFCEAVSFIIKNEEISGSINITAPERLTNALMVKELLAKFKPLFALPSPVFLLEIASIFLGTETELLLKSRNVFPQKLLDVGFEFKYSDFNACLKAL
jgi:uncharacterized protein